MGNDDRREIFERLEALERLVRSRQGEGRSRDERHRGDRDRDRRHHHRHDRDCDRDGGGEDFQEKRIIDTIVSLVSEQIGRLIEEQEHHSERRDEGGGEKRFVDLIVGLVSEHVHEIVVTELDRRLGPPKDKGGDRTADEAEGEDAD